MLHMNLRYNLQTDLLTFESITYSPVYIWRGRYDGQTAFQPILSSQAPPAYMDADQRDVMSRSLRDVRAVFANSVIQER
jgi:hypothetical protein